MNFIGVKKIYYSISLTFLLPGIVSLLIWGLKPAIDFTGGSLLEVRIGGGSTDRESIQEVAAAAGAEAVSVAASGDNSFLLKAKPFDQSQATQIKDQLAESIGEGAVVEEIRFETVGPTLGRELLVKTILAIILAAGFILAYVAWRFKEKQYGICAILAMFHDTLILLGSFSLLGRFFGIEVDMLFVTAVLTILSFSVHDTVVVYDRIRETVKENPKLTFPEAVNRAIAETLVRSLNNSLTIIFMLTALTLLGGATIRPFILALLIGTIAGTYSSTFTAAPLLVTWWELAQRRSRNQT